MNNIADTGGNVSVLYKGPTVFLPFTNIPLNEISYSHIHIFNLTRKAKQLNVNKKVKV